MKILPWLAGALTLLFWRWYGHLTLWQTLSVGALVLVLEGVLYGLKRCKAELVRIDSLSRLQDRLQYRHLHMGGSLASCTLGAPPMDYPSTRLGSALGYAVAEISNRRVRDR